jgi:DNA-directed RNA polymerase specialized sigma subunit
MTKYQRELIFKHEDDQLTIQGFEKQPQNDIFLTNTRVLKIHETAALIGYYKNGMTYPEIAELTGDSESYVRRIITEYLKTNPQ